METGHSIALIATQTPKTKKTPEALDGGGVSKVFKGTDQAISAYLKKALSNFTVHRVRSEKEGGAV
ncbi:hypothetical protein IQ225_16375 [Synechocystis salina LEGE 06155]|nr:hypothetical protein [Synechocystis salina LEGE 06155]